VSVQDDLGACTVRAAIAAQRKLQHSKLVGVNKIKIDSANKFID
jgi:hypothetical protein